MVKSRTLWTLWDADDTILGVKLKGEVVGTAVAYVDTLEKFSNKMVSLGFDKTLALETHKKIDMEAAHRLGFADKSRFPRSMRAAYITLAEAQQHQIDQDIADTIEAIGWSVFTDYPYTALPGALETLSEVSKEYLVAIVTKGEETEQHRKVFESGCFEYADQVIVMATKSVEEWSEKVVEDLRISPKIRAASWAIGNSVKSDVNPPLRLGFNGIHLADKEGWAFEKAEYENPLEGRILAKITDIKQSLSYLFPNN
jgi:FMN phosphatase YigB (HAD superfamily)